MKKHSTKRALLLSALAMLLCLSMLVGSTFAWFTDSVVSANNKIKAGTLEVQLLMFDGTEYADISETSAPIFGVGSIAQNNNAETLWEPGKTQVAYLAIKNNGTLALKYQVGLNVVNVANDLYEVMEYVITPDAQQGAVTAWDGTNAQGCVEGTQVVTTDVSLAVGATHYFALSIHMMEEAGNEYQNGEVNFDLVVLATQDTVEEDSFDNQYDALATYPEVGSGSATVVPEQEWYMVDLEKADGGKIGSALVHKSAIADGESTFKITVTPSLPYAGLTVGADQKAQGFDITATGLNDSFNPAIKIELGVGDGLTGVQVYHYDQLIESSYNDGSDNVIFETTSFSPFTVVYDAVAQETPAPVVPEGAPKAVVTDLTTTFDFSSIEWGNFGQWSPTEGLTSDLEGIWEFKCQETPEQAAQNPYANWYCDFYVKLDRDLGANQIFLGGNYGDFGWVGFHNGDFTLAANEEIPLLGSVTENPWTYEQVAEFVGTFLCGTCDVNNELSGAKFTVMLRLTNPENEAEFFNVATIVHTFN